MVGAEEFEIWNRLFVSVLTVAIFRILRFYIQ